MPRLKLASQATLRPLTRKFKRFTEKKWTPNSASHAARESQVPGGGFFWIIKLITVALSIACFIIGPLAVSMGFKALTSEKSAGFMHTTAAIRAFVCGAVLFVLGFALIYPIFTF